MKNLLFVICVAAGVLVGYFIPRGQSIDFTDKGLDSTTVNKIAQNPTIVRTILASHSYTYGVNPGDTAKNTETVITKDEAMKLIADFRKQNDDDILAGGGMQCRAPAQGSPTTELGGFFISKEAIDAIYKNDGSQKCTGLRIYLAKRPGAAAGTRFFTFIVAGAKDNGAKSTGGDIEAPIYEHVDPCPQNCGQLRP